MSSTLGSVPACIHFIHWAGQVCRLLVKILVKEVRAAVTLAYGAFTDGDTDGGSPGWFFICTS